MIFLLGNANLAGNLGDTLTWKHDVPNACGVQILELADMRLASGSAYLPFSAKTGARS